MTEALQTGWHHAAWLLGWILGALVPGLAIALAIAAAWAISTIAVINATHRIRVARAHHAARRSGRATQTLHNVAEQYR